MKTPATRSSIQIGSTASNIKSDMFIATVDMSGQTQAEKPSGINERIRELDRLVEWIMASYSLINYLQKTNKYELFV